MTPEKVIEMIQNILKCDPTKFLNSEKIVDLTDDEIVAALKTPKKSGTRFVYIFIEDCYSFFKFFLKFTGNS